MGLSHNNVKTEDTIAFKTHTHTLKHLLSTYLANLSRCFERTEILLLTKNSLSRT